MRLAFATGCVGEGGMLRDVERESGIKTKVRGLSLTIDTDSFPAAG